MLCSYPMNLESESETQTLRVLVGDDQPAVLEAIRLLLKGAGHAAVTSNNPAGVLREASADEFDVILIDLNYARDTTSGREGLDLITSLRQAGIEAPIIVMTAWGTVGVAVDAMRRGASDFVEKPWVNATLLSSLEHHASDGAKKRALRRKSDSELEVARNIQQRLLPDAAKPIANLQYAGCCKPAGNVGGDLYDFLPMDAGQTGFLLADVSGKGMGAALLMAHLQASFRTLSASGTDPVEEIAAEANRLFYAATPPEQYATVFFASYDEETALLRYVNAGHISPLLLRASGDIEWLDSTSTVLGLFPEWNSQPATVKLRAGDMLVAFSDGLEEVPTEVLTRAAQRVVLEEAGEAARSIAQLGTGVGQADDVTVLVLKATGSSAG